MVWIGKKILGKPKDKQDAFDMLKLLSDKTHSVSTGVALICKSEGFEKSLVETSQVTFKLLSDKTIKLYFQMVDPLDKAGAYAIQTRSDLIIKSFDGSKVPAVNVGNEVPVGYFSASKMEWRRLLRRMARAGVVRISTDFADPRQAAGCFCIDKRDNRLRFDLR